jgi:hypothetical protein
MELPELGDYDLPAPDAPIPLPMERAEEPGPEELVAERLAVLARAAVRSMRPGASWPRRRSPAAASLPGAEATQLPGSHVRPPAAGHSLPPGTQRSML